MELKRTDRREGPLVTVAAFFAGVVTLCWGVLEGNWFLGAAAIFILVVSAQYYIRTARHLPWR